MGNAWGSRDLRIRPRQSHDSPIIVPSVSTSEHFFLISGRDGTSPQNPAGLTRKKRRKGSPFDLNVESVAHFVLLWRKSEEETRLLGYRREASTDAIGDPERRESKRNDRVPEPSMSIRYCYYSR